MSSLITEQIEALKKRKNAVVMAHYYCDAAVQAVADYVGDSFYLAKVAKASQADIIVLCGVSFMGESAKLLNPDKKVLMPDLGADCAMAHMVTPGKVEQMRAAYEDLAVVCYINSTAQLKSQSDVCVTSSNAVNIVKKLPSRNIFFIPDQNLGRFVAEQVPEKNILLNDGFCPVHVKITADQIRAQKAAHPKALVLAHPECEAETLALADHIGSTAEIISFARESACREFIVATEQGVSFQLMQENPDKHFFFGDPCPCCLDMKKNTVEGILRVLEREDNAVFVDEALAARALLPLDRMLELAK